MTGTGVIEKPAMVKVTAGTAVLTGDVTIPRNPVGMVVFAHGSGSGRMSPRNRYVAEKFNRAGLATLLVDLLTQAEQGEDEITRRWRFDIPLLAGRVEGAARWLAENEEARHLPVGFYGASTGAAAALVAAARLSETVRAVVSRGGRPDLAGDALLHVKAPTLLIVGQFDEPVIGMNLDAASRMTAPHELVIVPGATHLFEEPGTLDKAALHAVNWFLRYLGAVAR